jgi:hypothetical protein
MNIRPRLTRQDAAGFLIKVRADGSESGGGHFPASFFAPSVGASFPLGEIAFVFVCHD